jgi:hypothetical protein
VLGIVFGILGIRRTANGQRRGRGMAIAGVVLGSIWVVLIGVGTVVSITDDSTRKDRAPVAAPHDVDIDTLKVGECINETPEEEPVTVPLVPCTQPHDGEVFAIYSLPGGKYPGDALVDRFAQGGCDKRFDTYAGAAADQSNWDVGFFGPSADLWADGDRRVFCLASHSDMSPLTGSVRA